MGWSSLSVDMYVLEKRSGEWDICFAEVCSLSGGFSDGIVDI